MMDDFRLTISLKCPFRRQLPHWERTARLRRRDRFLVYLTKASGLERPLPYFARRNRNAVRPTMIASAPETFRFDKVVVRFCRLLKELRLVVRAEELFRARHIQKSQGRQHIRSSGEIVQRTELILKI